jgi:alpha-L-fucosidase
MDWRDIRFNQKGNVLYVTAMGWPDAASAVKGQGGQLIIKSLRKGNPYGRKVGNVTLLGYGRVKARQTSEGLVVTLPAPCNKIAPVLKIN